MAVLHFSNGAKVLADNKVLPLFDGDDVVYVTQVVRDMPQPGSQPQADRAAELAEEESQQDSGEQSQPEPEEPADDGKPAGKKVGKPTGKKVRKLKTGVRQKLPQECLANQLAAKLRASKKSMAGAPPTGFAAGWLIQELARCGDDQALMYRVWAACGGRKTKAPNTKWSKGVGRRIGDIFTRLNLRSELKRKNSKPPEPWQQPGWYSVSRQAQARLLGDPLSEEELATMFETKPRSKKS